MNHHKDGFTLDDETRWQAVLTRSPQYNGQVYYGVRSTGIFCRPTCPSRRPRRDQIAFFATPEEAEQAGFRPCRRCKPEKSADPQVELTERACREIENSAGGLSLAELSRRVGVSPFHLHRQFKAVTGLTPRQYAESLRERQFREYIQQGQDLSGALYEAGYGSSSRLYASANQRLGMTPGAYKRGGTGMEIQFTIVDCRLGRMLVAATSRGICMVSFGAQDETLVSALKKEYPAAHITNGTENMTGWVSALLRYLEGQYPHLDLPLDVQATAFKMRVWDELRRIPFGETRTYAQVAQAIGSPAAVRAVGHACATNPVSVVTPCHRVLRTDGGLGGYRWGLDRKQILLDLEKSKNAEQ